MRRVAKSAFQRSIMFQPSLSVLLCEQRLDDRLMVKTYQNTRELTQAHRDLFHTYRTYRVFITHCGVVLSRMVN